MTQQPDAADSQPGSGGKFTADRASLQAIWNEHRRWIAAVLLAHKPRSVDLDDLLQEVAMTLVARINTLRDASNLRAWLRAVAVNAARAAARTAKNRPTVELNGTIASARESATDDSIVQSDEQSRIMQAMANLPETYREPLMLKAVRGMRTRQIAEALGIEEATVDTRVSRARRMIREHLEAADHAPHRFHMEPRS